MVARLFLVTDITGDARLGCVVRLIIIDDRSFNAHVTLGLSCPDASDSITSLGRA